MPDNTTYYNLFKYNLSNTTDLSTPFSIKDALNDNWDKIDSALNGKANISHSHSGYALISHTHSDYAILTASRAVSGYLKLNSGSVGQILFQWGKETSTSGTTTSVKLVTTPVAYTSSLTFVILTTCYHTTNSNTYERYIQEVSSNSSFKIHTYSDSSAPVFWMTVGY